MATTLKVVLLGGSGAGKTCIIDNLYQGIFEQNTGGTLTCSFIKKTIELEELNQKINFEIWDTPGTIKLKEIIELFYKDANAICLCYDPTCRCSFEELKNDWYEKGVKIDVETDPILVIVATKNDLDKEVKDEEGKAFAEEINAMFQSTSAKSNNGIKSLFANIARKYFDPSYDCRLKIKKERIKIK